LAICSVLDWCFEKMVSLKVFALWGKDLLRTSPHPKYAEILRWPLEPKAVNMRA
jgi:hypothetical protein